MTDFWLLRGGHALQLCSYQSYYQPVESFDGEVISHLVGSGEFALGAIVVEDEYEAAHGLLCELPEYELSAFIQPTGGDGEDFDAVFLGSGQFGRVVELVVVILGRSVCYQEDQLD